MKETEALDLAKEIESYENCTVIHFEFEASNPDRFSIQMQIDGQSQSIRNQGEWANRKKEAELWKKFHAQPSPYVHTR